MSAINSRQQVLDMIQKAADNAAAKGVEVTVQYSEFTIDGKIQATITAIPPRSK